MNLPAENTHKENTKGRLIGIGEMCISKDSRDLLLIPNLGSCLGLFAYDPSSKIGGGIHCLLPLSTVEPEKAKANPLLYVDSGVAIFLSELIKAGASRIKLKIVATGCANINDKNNTFEIGKKNHTVFRKLMWKNNFLIATEDIGGGYPRTVQLRMDNGNISVTTQGKLKQLSY
jgi:chemotaxis protein CheD